MWCSLAVRANWVGHSSTTSDCFGRSWSWLRDVNIYTVFTWCIIDTHTSFPQSSNNSLNELFKLVFLTHPIHLFIENHILQKLFLLNVNLTCCMMHPCWAVFLNYKYRCRFCNHVEKLSTPPFLALLFSPLLVFFSLALLSTPVLFEGPLPVVLPL